MKLLVTLLLLLITAPAEAADLYFAWDQSPDPVDGYRLHRSSEHIEDNNTPQEIRSVGKVLLYEWKSIPDGLNFFRLTAYNAYGSSGYSDEIALLITRWSVSMVTSSSSSSSSTTTTACPVCPPCPTSTTTSRPSTTTSLAGGCAISCHDCVVDRDYDGIGNAADNCPSSYNPRQLDADKDGKGDVCDTGPGCGAVGQMPCERIFY